MCSVGKRASLELTYYPLETVEVNRSVDRVLDLLRVSGLQLEIGAMSTVVRGEIGELLALIERIHETAEEHRESFSLVMKLSNACGCKE
jgi:uncharacterized protein YqgV (UPF0045/DUF77 family)